MSPFLYYLLKPEVWPENFDKIEMPKMTPYHPKVVYDEKFYQKIKSIVKPEKYMANGDYALQITKSDLRTIAPVKDAL